MPLQRRLPKRGFKNYPFKKEFSIVNIGRLSTIEEGDMITPEVLLEKGIIKKMKDGVKILGGGGLSKPMHIKAHAFSSSALEKIKSAGGKTEVI
jgi:large subunit ribosomal protein L15